MIHADEKTLDLFRGPGPCEHCLWFCDRREPAHILSRGAGRVDVPENLVALGGAFACGCHVHSHNGQEPGTKRLFEIAARREGVTPDYCEHLVYWVRRAPKEANIEDVRAAFRRFWTGETLARGTADHRDFEGDLSLPDRTVGPGPDGRLVCLPPSETGQWRNL